MAKASIAKTDPTTARVGEVVDMPYGEVVILEGPSGGPPPPGGEPPPPGGEPDDDTPPKVQKPQPPPEKPEKGEKGEGEGEGEDGEKEEGEEAEGEGEGEGEPGEGEGEGDGGDKPTTIKEDIENTEGGAKGASKPEDSEGEGQDKTKPRTKDHQCGAAGLTPEQLEEIIKEAQERGELGEGVGEVRLDILRKDAAKKYKRFTEEGTWEGKGGTSSGGADRWAEAAEGPPSVPWEQVLKRTMRSLVGELNDKWKSEASYERLSRRTMAQVMGDESPLEPALQSSPAGFDVALAVDTSASVSDYGLAQALREAALLLRAPGVARVLWMSIDWAVSAVHEVIPEGIPTGKRAAMKKFQPFLKGGGGTDMSQAIYYTIKANKERKRRGQTLIPAVVVFTDGGTGWPPAKDVRKAGLEVIVVLISPGNSPDVVQYTKALAPYAKVIVAK